MHELVIRGGTIVDGTGAPAFIGDVAIDDGGSPPSARSTAGAREVDADGLAVTPGWVDIHTHYDGQVTWDPEVTPSSWHGVTTVVMGNCGVGFAPVRPDGHDLLIELMEGVEDIPGTALHEGMDWQWESFPEYLDALDVDRAGARHRRPGPPRRAARLRDGRARPRRRHRRRDRRDGAADQQALEAGAAGFSTSRTMLHRSKHGLVPGTRAPLDELLALGDAVGEAGHGVFQLIADGSPVGEAGEWMAEIARRTGATVTYSLAQSGPTRSPTAAALEATPRRRPTACTSSRRCLPADRDAVRAAVVAPPVHHPPDVPRLSQLPLAERVAELRRPEIRAALLAEEPQTGSPVAKFLISRWDRIFPLGDPPDYEPAPETSVAAVAAARDAVRRRSCSTGCSSATARPSCSPRSPATRTRTSTPSAR